MNTSRLLNITAATQTDESHIRKRKYLSLWNFFWQWRKKACFFLPWHNKSRAYHTGWIICMYISRTRLVWGFCFASLKKYYVYIDTHLDRELPSLNFIKVEKYKRGQFPWRHPLISLNCCIICSASKNIERKLDINSEKYVFNMVYDIVKCRI